MSLLENIKKDFVRAAARAYHRGIQTGNGGNLSARVPNGERMAVKPSGISFIDCNEENLIIRSDKSVPLETVIQVLDAAKGIGIEKFVIETEKKTI